jgi:hypothetical protein
VRRRPVGAVIADICRDLGIMPGQLDRAFWEELSRAIIIYGGSLAGFLPNLSGQVSSTHGSHHTESGSPADGDRHRPTLNLSPDRDWTAHRQRHGGGAERRHAGVRRHIAQHVAFSGSSA